MGVGDRHSKRAALEKQRASSAIQRSYVVDDRELDDPFSAWDDDDAGAHKPSLAHAASSVSARTRVERKPAAEVAPAERAPEPPPVLASGSARRTIPLDALVDPVAMRDIVISRARTLDDPLTTRVLAEIARNDANGEVTPPRGEDRATHAPSVLATELRRARDTRDEISLSRRRTHRRPPLVQEEPPRKK
jgi:hypothetical protein